MHAPVRLVAPETPPLTLERVKSHLRVDFADDDALITGLIAAATDALDGYTGILGRALVTQKWQQVFDRFTGCMRLPLAPVASIEKIEYFDAENERQTVAAEIYELFADEIGPYVALKAGASWPATFARAASVSITYVAGSEVATVPPAVCAAILLHVAHLYANREAVGDTSSVALPLAYSALIAPYRRLGV